MTLFNIFKTQSESNSNQTSSSQTQYSEVSNPQTSTAAYSGIGNPSSGQAYSGIGNPPSGKAYSGIGNPPTGKAYSGIGNPPSGQAYSGIGNPPQQSVIQTESNSENSNLNPSYAKYQQQYQTPPANENLQSQQQKNEPKNNDQTYKTQDTQIPPGQNTNLNTKQAQLDLMTHLTQRSNRVFLAAHNKAKECQTEYIDSEHVLHGLLTDPEIYKLFTELKISPQAIEQELASVYQRGSSQKPPIPSPRVKRILDNALIIARKLGYEFISPEHILLSLYEEGEGAGARILSKLGLKKEDLNKKILGKKESALGEKKEEHGKNTLEQYTTDLTEKAAQGLLDPVVERADVIERVIHILSRRTKNNPVLIGEAGVGKTAIVEGLAQKIVKKEVPEPLFDKKVLQLDLMSIIAGASHRGEFEERMKKVIEEIKASGGKIILFIDEIHNLVGAGAGGEGSLDASNFLKPSLARGELQVIGATTTTEYKYIEKDPALERRFQPVIVPEPTVEQAIKMLKSLKDKYEAFHRVKITDDAIEAAVKLSKRYVGDRFLPDKAIDLIDEACSAARLPLISLPEEIRSLEERISQLRQEYKEFEAKGNTVKMRILNSKIEELTSELKEKQDKYNLKKAQTTTSIGPEMIKDIISSWTGIPVSKLTESEISKLTKLEEIMHERLINQETAVSAVAQAVRRGRAGLKSTKRPIGSFVFLGPTGVGKTELSKTLAEVLFGQESAMIRFDMTEYMEKHEVAKLLGAPPGYVGYEEGGKLTEAVRRKPYSVVLFDEVEKAHPDIFNILLQILDDGRLTDNKGRTISFKNTVVICTSNIGTKIIQDELLKSGKIDIEEPTLLSTYTFSPRGRQILTIMGKVFIRDNENSEWQSQMLLDYFSGQKIELDEAQKASQTKAEFPTKEFDTHAISAKGVEMISQEDKLFIRTSTTAKVWKMISLIDYVKDNVVINALPDTPEQQLPTARIKTHAFSPDEFEIISFRDRFWKRKESTLNWETGTLKDYFADSTIEENNNTNTDVSSKKTLRNFPTTYWDIHAFDPSGKEIIIVADTIWYRQKDSKVWKTSSLKDYFGDNFPLEKEINEKKAIEAELAKNQYEKIKSKVMEELRKFFRPELINRFDEVVIFEPLQYSHMLLIVDLQLKGVQKLLEEQNIGFVWTKAASKELVMQGFDPIYGARPLARTIQKLIENPISSLIIEKKVVEGDTIVVDFESDSFIFNIEKTVFVDETQANQFEKKKFNCQDCKKDFESIVPPNCTIICPYCTSSNIREIKNISNIDKQDEQNMLKKNESVNNNNESKNLIEEKRTNEKNQIPQTKPTSFQNGKPISQNATIS